MPAVELCRFAEGMLNIEIVEINIYVPLFLLLFMLRGECLHNSHDNNSALSRLDIGPKYCLPCALLSMLVALGQGPVTAAIGYHHLSMLSLLVPGNILT